MHPAGEYLLRFGIRPSVQRTEVMAYLMTHHTHPTVDEIYMALVGRIPTLSRTTVYNTLRLLVQCGAVKSVEIDRTCERFDADTSLHAHFMCDCCGRIFDLPAGADAAMPVAVPPGFEVRSVSLSYTGRCDGCNNRETNA